MERGVESREGRKVMSLSLPGSKGPQTVASPTVSISLHCFYELSYVNRPRNRRGSSQVHITRRRFNMTFPPPSVRPSAPMCQGRKERRTTVAAALMNLKHSRTTFFSPSFPPLLLFVPFSPPLSLSRPCLCIGNSPGGRQRKATRWFCPRE